MTSSRPIETLDQLKQETGAILQGISESCRECEYPDCQGYPWIVPEEEAALLDAGLRVVQFNGEQGPIYLDTFERNESGRLLIGKHGNRCPYRAADGSCQVHANRPLVCHLYPLSLEFSGGVAVWAVHRDCEFIQRETHAGRYEQILDSFRAMIARLAPSVRAALATTMERAASVSERPEMDCYDVLGPVLESSKHS